MVNLISTNPADNYKKLGSVKISTFPEIKKKVAEANKAKLGWKELGVEKRTKLLSPLFKEFLKRKKEIAELTTKEIGKPISDALADVDWDVDYFKAYLDDGVKFLKDEITFKKDQEIHKIVYEPFGVAAVIAPWNFPFSNFMWGVIPNLIAGNTVVFKHSEECPLMGKFIDDYMKTAKLPKGVFSQVYGDGKVGEMLVNQEIDFIWFTGSSKIGKKLFELAGKKFIKAVLELGGSNPHIIFPDVKVDDKLIAYIFSARFSNNGQVCDSLKRLIVHESLFNQIVEKLKTRVEKAVIGNPMDKKTELGSLVAKRQLDLLKQQVEDAVKKGAKIITGGEEPKEFKGAYYLPTILANIKWNMRVWKEEVFGPVLPIVSFKTEKEAIKLANDTEYGLGAKVYSKDKKRALRVAERLQAGCIDVNKGNHWLTCNPFGGYKRSGMGREHGRIGYQELTQIKVISTA